MRLGTAKLISQRPFQQCTPSSTPNRTFIFLNVTLDIMVSSLVVLYVLKSEFLLGFGLQIGNNSHKTL